MLVRMRYQMSGGRHDGQPWPALNGTIEVPEWEARDLFRAEIALPEDDEAKALADNLAEQPTPGHPSKLDPRPPSQAEGEGLAAQAAAEQGDPAAVPAAEQADPVAAEQGDPAAVPASEPFGELPGLAPDAAGKDEAGGSGNAGGDAAEYPLVAEAPGPSAPKQAWIDYAVQAHGADVHAASLMTKADLMSRYGGRL